MLACFAKRADWCAARRYLRRSPVLYSSISAWPPSAAACSRGAFSPAAASGVSLEAFAALSGAPRAARKSASSASRRLLAASIATCRGVEPSSSTASRRAPASTSALEVSRRSELHAPCSGVAPRASRASTAEPAGCAHSVAVRRASSAQPAPSDQGACRGGPSHGSHHGACLRCSGRAQRGVRGLHAGNGYLGRARRQT